MATPASEAASATAITEAGAVCLLPPLAAPAVLDLPDDGGGGCGGSGCSLERLICGGGSAAGVCCLLAAAVSAIPWAMETTAGGGPSGIGGGLGVVAVAGVPAADPAGLPSSAASSSVSGGSS